MNPVSTESTTTLLEELLSRDCKCESQHPTSLCSIEVVAIASNCSRPEWFKVCQSYIDAMNWELDSRKPLTVICATCNRLASDCWKIRPI